MSKLDFPFLTCQELCTIIIDKSLTTNSHGWIYSKLQMPIPSLTTCMWLNQCTSVHNNLFIFLGLHHHAGWERGNWRYTYDPCTIIIPTLICTVWETDLWDAYLLSHCNQLWRIKLGHNTFQNLRVHNKCYNRSKELFRMQIVFLNVQRVTKILNL